MLGVFLIFFSVISLMGNIQSDTVFIENFGFSSDSSFQMSSTLSGFLIDISFFSQFSGNRIRCLSHCSQLEDCLTVEITKDPMQTDQITKCAFYSAIPNFNSTDVIASVSSNIYVKKSAKIQFNQSCIYDNCQQDSGLTCVTGRCLCRDNNRYDLEFH
jgi:hypothetical protein